MTFIINPHGRLQEWVAEEKGYFRQAGLTDYELRAHRLLTRDAAAARTPAGANDMPDNLNGAYQTYEEGREASISCACHWTVNMAASNAHGRLWGEAYTITPAAIFVPEASPIRKPEDLAGVNIHVGYQSGSHYTTIQALEPFMSLDKIQLKFGGGPADRVDQLLNGVAPAATVFGPQLYLVEQLGFRKIIDCTFMIAALMPEHVDIEDVRKYFEALRMAQADIDRFYQAHVHHYLKELPERHAKLVDVRRFGPGERIVFEPYSREMYETTHEWVEQRAIFDAEKVGRDPYEQAVARIA